MLSAWSPCLWARFMPQGVSVVVSTYTRTFSWREFYRKPGPTTSWRTALQRFRILSLNPLQWILLNPRLKRGTRKSLVWNSMLKTPHWIPLTIHSSCWTWIKKLRTKKTVLLTWPWPLIIRNWALSNPWWSLATWKGLQTTLGARGARRGGWLRWKVRWRVLRQDLPAKNPGPRWKNPPLSVLHRSPASCTASVLVSLDSWTPWTLNLQSPLRNLT